MAKLWEILNQFTLSEKRNVVSTCVTIVTVTVSRIFKFKLLRMHDIGGTFLVFVVALVVVRQSVAETVTANITHIDITFFAANRLEV